MQKKFFGSLMALFVCGILFAQTAGAAPDRVPGQILVKFKANAENSGKSDIAKLGSVKDAGMIGGVGVHIYNVPEGAEDNIIRALSKNPNVEYAEPDYIATVAEVALPNDSYFGNQWGLHNVGQSIAGTVGADDADIDAPEAWTITKGDGTDDAISNGTIVAVLDTGVDQDHEDLSGKIVINKDFTLSTSGAEDMYGHGTHVAGIIAANTNNVTGVAGVCPDCRIMNIKVLGDDGSGSTSGIASGIYYAADNGAKVINMSLGSAFKSTTLETAVKYAWGQKGVVVVAAAGNSGRSQMFYPAAYTNCIAVASTDNTDLKSSFSNYGASWVDVAAPGRNIYSTMPNHPSALSNGGYSMNYSYLSGTSMATPMVAGTAGLVWSKQGITTAPQVRYQIESTAEDIAGTGTTRSSYWRWGRINAAEAVGLLSVAAK